jgi:hypothetical protein
MLQMTSNVCAREVMLTPAHPAIIPIHVDSLGSFPCFHQSSLCLTPLLHSPLNFFFKPHVSFGLPLAILLLFAFVFFSFLFYVSATAPSSLLMGLPFLN